MVSNQRSAPPAPWMHWHRSSWVEQGCSPSQTCLGGASLLEECGAAKGIISHSCHPSLRLIAQEISSSSSCIREHLRISYYPQSLSGPMTAISSVDMLWSQPVPSLGCEMLLGRSFGQRRGKEGSAALFHSEVPQPLCCSGNTWS